MSSAEVSTLTSTDVEVSSFRLDRCRSHSTSASRQAYSHVVWKHSAHGHVEYGSAQRTGSMGTGSFPILITTSVDAALRSSGCVLYTATHPSHSSTHNPQPQTSCSIPQLCINQQHVQHPRRLQAFGSSSSWTVHMAHQESCLQRLGICHYFRKKTNAKSMVMWFFFSDSTCAFHGASSLTPTSGDVDATEQRRVAKSSRK